jgi:hypothetical protein
MAEPHVLTALVEKYRELSGKLHACEQEVETLRLDLSHIDAAIRVFRHDYDTTSIVPKRHYHRNPHFKKGAFIQAAMDVLQAATCPLTTRELAKQTLERQGISQSNKRFVETLQRTLNDCLMRRATKGTVVADNSRPRRWKITPVDGVTSTELIPQTGESTEKGGAFPESLKAVLRTLSPGTPLGGSAQTDGNIGTWRS